MGCGRVIVYMCAFVLLGVVLSFFLCVCARASELYVQRQKHSSKLLLTRMCILLLTRMCSPVNCF
jgi:hypothetical protein